MWTMKQKYEDDPHYRRLVDLMTAMIMEYQFTPSEMREAAVAASIKYEQMRAPRPIYFDKETEDALEVLRRKYTGEEK